MDKLKESEYECAHCHNVYEKGWSDEDAQAEATAIFGKKPDEWNDEQVVICDDCFTEMYPPAHPELLEKTRKFI